MLYVEALPQLDPSVADMRSHTFPPFCWYSVKQTPVYRMQGTNVTSASESKEDGAVMLPEIAKLPSSVHDALMLDAEKIPELQNVDPKSKPGQEANDGATSTNTKSHRNNGIDDEFMIAALTQLLIMYVLEGY